MPEYANATFTAADGTVKPWTDPMKRYATMARRLDDGVGDILQLLRDLNIDQDTLVVFSSDNGPANEAGGDPPLLRLLGPVRWLQARLLGRRRPRAHARPLARARPGRAGSATRFPDSGTGCPRSPTLPA